MNEMTLPPRHNSSPVGLEPSTLPLGHGDIHKKIYTNKNHAVLNIIESYFLQQTEADIKAMGHACNCNQNKYICFTNNYFRVQKLA